MRYLALCCIVKDEDPFLKEWIAYHTLLGVEHFIIYDNMSARPVQELLDGFAGPDLVTVRRVAGQSMQMPCYQNCLDDFGTEFKWIGFLDLDEFVCPTRDTDLRLLLSEFEAHAGLGLTWRIFSSSGHLGRPDGPVLHAYTECFPPEEMPDDIHIKSFVQPGRVSSVPTPHSFDYTPGNYAVTEDHCPIPGNTPFAPSTGKLARINHYFYRSQQDFEQKLRRGRADVAAPEYAHALQKFYDQARKKTLRDKKIQRFLPKLERLLQAPYLNPPASPCPDAASFEQYWAASQGLMHQGKLKEAQLCLCYAALNHADVTELWLLRAMLARLDKRLERAERFLTQALSMQERPQTYLELIKLRQLQGRDKDARELALFLRHLLQVRGLLTPEWQATLDALPS